MPARQADRASWADCATVISDRLLMAQEMLAEDFARLLRTDERRRAMKSCPKKPVSSSSAASSPADALLHHSPQRAPFDGRRVATR